MLGCIGQCVLIHIANYNNKMISIFVQLVNELKTVQEQIAVDDDGPSEGAIQTLVRGSEEDEKSQETGWSVKREQAR